MPLDTEEGFARSTAMDSWSSNSSTSFVNNFSTRWTRPAQEGFDYSRTNNPSRNCLETCLAALEDCEHCIVFSSGLGAVTALLSLLNAGDHVLCSEYVYGGTNELFKSCADRENIKLSFADPCDTEDFLISITANAKLVWIETPSNPLLKLADIKALTKEIKSARPDIYVVVDNTFATCYFQRPLDLGADVTHYPVTKYLNGHSDVTMGAALTRRDDIHKKLRFTENAMGIVPSPFDCAMVIRSLKTLELRMQQHMKNSLTVAKFLESHPIVNKVMHPLLPSHPQHELAKKQMSGHSGMLCFYHNGNSQKLLKALKVFSLADSLGSCESLAGMPFLSSHAMISEEERAQLGITNQLIRLSVGLESEKDLIDDLDQALKASIQ